MYNVKKCKFYFRYNFTKYERQIGLDKHVSRKKKNRGKQDESKTSDQSGVASQSENVSKKTCPRDRVKVPGNITDESSAIPGSHNSGHQSELKMNKNQSKTQRCGNQSKTAGNQSGSKITDNQSESQIAQQQSACDIKEKENIKSEDENVCSKGDMKHSDEKIATQCQEDTCNKMSENKRVEVKETKQSRSNFEDIEFPNFKSTGDKVLVPCPNTKYIPQGCDVSFSDCVYSFEKKLYINTKKITRKQRILDEAVVQQLDFSYPEIMTGWYKVKKSCSNWKQYKAALQKEKSTRNRSAKFPHLYGDKVKPLVQPENSKSTCKIFFTFLACLFQRKS